MNRIEFIKVINSIKEDFNEESHGYPFLCHALGETGIDREDHGSTESMYETFFKLFIPNEGDAFGSWFSEKELDVSFNNRVIALLLFEEICLSEKLYLDF